MPRRCRIRHAALLRTGGALLGAAALLLLTPRAGPARQNPLGGKPEVVEVGRGMFRIYCAGCHGIRGQGGRGPDLVRGASGKGDAELFRVITEGVSGTAMEGYADELETDNIWRLVAFVRSIAQPATAPIAGDRAAGEKLFAEKGRCGQCHRIGTRGGRLGPDLSTIGRQRSVAYLREAVVSPNADITPGFATVTVVTNDGKTIVGVERAIDNFSAQLVDPAENYHSYLRSDVRSIERKFRSLMPDDYGKKLSAGELDDLVAYLVSLRGPETTRAERQ